MFSFKKFGCLLVGLTTISIASGTRSDIRLSVYEITDKMFNNFGQPAVYETFCELLYSGNTQIHSRLPEAFNTRESCWDVIIQMKTSLAATAYIGPGQNPRDIDWQSPGDVDNELLRQARKPDQSWLSPLVVKQSQQDRGRRPVVTFAFGEDLEEPEDFSTWARYFEEVSAVHIALQVTKHNSEALRAAISTGLLRKADQCLFLAANDDPIIPDEHVDVTGVVSRIRVLLPHDDEVFVSAMRAVNPFLNFVMQPIFRRADLGGLRCPDSDGIPEDQVAGIASDHCFACLMRRFFMLRDREQDSYINELMLADILLSRGAARDGSRRLIYAIQNTLRIIDLIMERNPGDDRARRLYRTCIIAVTEFHITFAKFAGLEDRIINRRPTLIEKSQQPDALAEYEMEVRELRQSVSDKLEILRDRFYPRGAMVEEPNI
ncbi:MAG: hypothetical protein LBL30_04580 [Holosporales bacterium]|jgi:hypothetical protein|nr:hypothetical protein [Holosporales bacterium]